MTDCLICNRIAMIQAGTNPYFVTELPTGYVVIGDHQFFRGYTLLLSRWHVRELHDLDWDRRIAFLQDMALTAEAVCQAFAPRKLNYELLGNADEHLHWHLFPRHADDPKPTGPVWEIDPALTRADAARPSPDDLRELTVRLRAEIELLKASNPTRKA
ncbi:MAG: HIT family protein [Chloroflexota bacterium]